MTVKELIEQLNKCFLHARVEIMIEHKNEQWQFPLNELAVCTNNKGETKYVVLIHEQSPQTMKGE